MNVTTTSLTGPFQETVKAGIGLLGNAIEKIHDVKSAVLLVPSLGSFDSTVTAQALGPTVTKELVKNRSIKMPNGVKLHLHSPKTISRSEQAEILLAVFVSAEQTETVISKMHGLKAVVFVPWMDSDRDAMISIHDATVFNVPDPRNDA